MPGEHEKYTLKVTAGPAYDPSTHSIVHVNTSTPVKIKTADIDATVFVRIQNYRGLPSSSPPTCAYFAHPSHKTSLYSISFSFTLPRSISGNDLVFGNDFDRPIRDVLPPGFGTAFRIVKWAIDPGLEGDVEADKPWLYGPGLSSWNALRVGGRSDGEKDADGKGGGNWEGDVVEEGADADGKEVREKGLLPDDGGARMKYFLNAERRKEFTFEAGREYKVDFFNPYLDFNEFALKLPGFTLHIIKYWDGQPLRYVLRDRSTDTVLFVVVFDLILSETLQNESSAKTSDSHATAQPDKPAGNSGYVDDDVD